MRIKWTMKPFSCGPADEAIGQGVVDGIEFSARAWPFYPGSYTLGHWNVYVLLPGETRDQVGVSVPLYKVHQEDASNKIGALREGVRRRFKKSGRK